MKPVRVQLQRTRGWRMPPNTVKVDRSTRYGNPYEVVERRRGGVRRFDVVRGSTVFCGPLGRVDATAVACRQFRVVVVPTLDLTPLRGRNLACWCQPGDQCHADVLLELANA